MFGRSRSDSGPDLYNRVALSIASQICTRNGQFDLCEVLTPGSYGCIA